MNIELIVAVVSTFLLALSVLYAGIQVKQLRDQHRQNHDWNRRLAAQQAVRDYSSIHKMVESISEHFDYQNKTEGIGYEVFDVAFDETPELQSRLHQVLNYFEGLARGVRQGIYDEEVIEAAFKGHMKRVYESFKYYIEGRRREFHNPRMWVELEEVSEIWKKEERVINERRPPIAP